MYIVIEMQTNADCDVATIVTKHPTREEAESKYYTVLSAAALSTVPIHAATVLRNDGQQILYKSYSHSIIINEEETENG